MVPVAPSQISTVPAPAICPPAQLHVSQTCRLPAPESVPPSIFSASRQDPLSGSRTFRTPAGLDPVRLALAGADLHAVHARELRLRGARLWHTNLEAAVFVNADLHGANLVGARLHNASLRGADLGGAVLTGASLHGVDLTGARVDADTRWDGAIYDDTTAWPSDEFDPEMRGAVRASCCGY